MLFRSLARGLSSRASAVLSALDLRTENELDGVYDGEWTGSGEIFESVCPTTGEVLARVKSVSVSWADRLGVRRSHLGAGHTGRVATRIRADERGIQDLQARSCTQAWRDPAANTRGTGSEGVDIPAEVARAS